MQDELYRTGARAKVWLREMSVVRRVAGETGCESSLLKPLLARCKKIREELKKKGVLVEVVHLFEESQSMQHAQERAVMVDAGTDSAEGCSKAVEQTGILPVQAHLERWGMIAP